MPSEKKKKKSIIQRDQQWMGKKDSKNRKKPTYFDNMFFQEAFFIWDTKTEIRQNVFGVIS